MAFCFCFLKEKTAAIPRLWPGQVIQRLSPVAVGHGGPGNNLDAEAQGFLLCNFSFYLDEIISKVLVTLQADLYLCSRRTDASKF